MLQEFKELFLFRLVALAQKASRLAGRFLLMRRLRTLEDRLESRERWDLKDRWDRKALQDRMVEVVNEVQQALLESEARLEQRERSVNEGSPALRANVEILAQEVKKERRGHKDLKDRLVQLERRAETAMDLLFPPVTPTRSKSKSKTKRKLSASARRVSTSRATRRSRSKA